MLSCGKYALCQGKGDRLGWSPSLKNTKKQQSATNATKKDISRKIAQSWRNLVNGHPA